MRIKKGCRQNEMRKPLPTDDPTQRPVTNATEHEIFEESSLLLLTIPKDATYSHGLKELHIFIQTNRVGGCNADNIFTNDDLVIIFNTYFHSCIIVSILQTMFIMIFCVTGTGCTSSS